MKKILSIFLVLLAVLSLAACKGKGNENQGGQGGEQPVQRTYVADGKYTAFTAHTNYGNPQITWVTVTIENDQIKSFYIDQLQSDSPAAWKAQTKKELGYAYRMHGQWTLSEEDYVAWLKAEEKLEWFEQANLIETQLLVSTDITVNAEGYIEGIAGVSIADNNYIALAKKAVENAKAGIVTVFDANIYSSNANITFAEAKVNAEGKIVEVKIDELQSAVTDEVWGWKAQTKQQLQYGYRMHGQWTLSEEEYKAYLVENNKLEWFQQADAIAAAWLGGADVSDIKTVSGVSIFDNAYSKVLAALLAEGWTK